MKNVCNGPFNLSFQRFEDKTWKRNLQPASSVFIIGWLCELARTNISKTYYGWSRSNQCKPLLGTKIHDFVSNFFRQSHAAGVQLKNRELSQNARFSRFLRHTPIACLFPEKLRYKITFSASQKSFALVDLQNLLTTTSKDG